MRELHYGGRWPSESCCGFRVPGVEPEPLPTTAEEIELELASMLGAARAIELDVTGKTIQPPWNAYLACRNHIERFHLWYPAQRDRIRQLHRPNIPRLGGRSITSYIEAAAEICAARVQWLDSRIDYPEDHQIGQNDVTPKWCATFLATHESQYIYDRWPFQAIDFAELHAGIRLELSWLARGAAATGDAASPQINDAYDPTLQDRGPSWDADKAELIFDGEVVKRVKHLSQAKNVVRVLDAFQDCGWPIRIDDPLPGGRDSQRLGDAIKSLNSGLSRMKFERDGSGEGIRWRRN